MLIKKISLLFILLLLVTGLYSRGLEEIKRSGKIYIAFTSDDLKNINYDLAQEFAKYLNVDLIEVEIEWDEAFMRNGLIPDDLKTNPDIAYSPDALKKADIICSTFTVIEWRKKLFGFAGTLESAELLLINKKDALPEGFEDLKEKRIAFMKSTTFEQHLKEINQSIGGGIDLVYTKSNADAKELLKQGEVYGIILDADEALNFNAENGNKYNIAFPISEVSKSAWAAEKNNPLIQEVENFFETISNNEVLDKLFYARFGISYFAYVEKINKNLRLTRYNRDLDEILESKKLIIALRDRNFIYRPDGQKQFMHALAEEFADYLGVSLEFVITPYFGKYWETKEGDIYRDSSYTPDWFNYFDLACEIIAPLDWRSNKVDLVPVYPTAYTVIAKKETQITSLEDLHALKGVTGEQTVYADILQKNGISNFYYENFNNFITDVSSGKADYTIVYNAFYEISNYPDLEVKLTLDDLDVCWALRKDQPLLKNEMENFLSKSSENGLIKVLLKALRGNTLQSPEAFINSYYESFQTGQLPYVNYGADDGLPQEDIFSIFQDKKGYLWFGTNSGAVRYNGREMVVYNHMHGLPDNSVRDIKQDSSGIMYFATTNGITLFEGDTTIQILMEGISFKKTFIDSENNKWFISDQGVYRESAEGTVSSVNSEFPILPEAIYSIVETPETKDILFATSKGVYIFERERKAVLQLSGEDCFSLFIDVNDSIWISTKTGLYITALEELKKQKEDVFHNLNKRLRFPVNIISEITSNKFGSVWLISDSQILQIISTDQDPIVYEQDIGIKNNKILSFLIDKEDNLWIGFSGGLQRLTPRQGLRNFSPDAINSYIYSIFEDDYNRIWITSDNGIFYFERNLVNFTPITGSANKKFIGTLLPNDNILLANTSGLYEVSSRTLEIVRHTIFDQVALSLENVFVSEKGEIFLLTGIDGIIYYFPNFYSQPFRLKNKFTSNIFQLVEYEGEIIGGNSTGLVRFNGEDFESLSKVDCNVWSLKVEGNSVWIGTDCGIGIVKDGRFDQIEFSTFDKDIVIKSIIPAKNKNYIWLGTNKGFSYFNKLTQKNEFVVDTKDGLSGDEITTGGLFIDHNDLLWIGTYHGISNFNIRAQLPRSYAPVCYIEKALMNGNPVKIQNNMVFGYKDNNLVFEISALSFTDEESVEYEFYLRGTGNKFTSYHRGKEYKAYYNNLPAGTYDFIYKAKGKNNIWGYAEKFEFTIQKAWYKTWLFRITIGILFILIIYTLYMIRIQAIKAQKKRLEQQVKERTKELEDANTEIEIQRDLAREQRDKIGVQQKEIMDSIHYAQRIQDSLLPSEKVLKKLLPDHFILYKPRDIVSGDYYWATEKGDYIYISAADCTGHGIPGAFMSMLGMALMSEIVNKFENIEPDELLNQLRKYIIRTLNQSGEPGEAKDGMDMVVCKFHKNRKKLTFACANNPVYLIRNNELTEFKGDKMPVAIHEVMTPFKSFEIDILSGDTIYLFSDGFADQFGGPKNKKFLYSRFKNLLLDAQSRDLKSQGVLLDTAIDQWKGGVEQIDDIVVIGIRF